MTSHETRTPFLGWRMVAIAFLSFNTVMGLVPSAFGTLLPTLQQELGVSRAAAAAIWSATLTGASLMSPVIGNLARVVSLKSLMLGGAAANAVAFVLLAYATEYHEILLLFGLAVGGSMCAMGLIGAPTLVSRWFVQGRGKALGFACTPMFILVAPPVVALLIERGGRQTLFLVLAGIFATLIPLLLLIVDEPKKIGQQPRGAAEAAKAAIAEDLPAGSRTRIFRDRRFLLISLVIGMFTATSVAFVSHGAAIALERGIPLTLASSILSAYGGGMLFGAIILGWLIDRIGPFASLAIVCGLEAVVWIALAHMSDLLPMILMASLIGMGSGATVALHTASIGSIFPIADVSRALGYSYLIKAPFLFGGPAIAGYLFDRTGDYRVMLMAYGMVLGCAAVLGLLLALDGRRPASNTASLEPAGGS
jgi:MFS family permease